jgi:hypothetical protein
MVSGTSELKAYRTGGREAVKYPVLPSGISLILLRPVAFYHILIVMYKKF